MIVIGHKVIRADICAEIREATFYSVMADEVTSHNDEIMYICIRFVDQKKQIRKKFLDFIALGRITGGHLAENMEKFYNDVNLDIISKFRDNATMEPATCHREKRD